MDNIPVKAVDDFGAAELMQVSTIRRTMLGAKLSSENLIGLDYRHVDFTTLNEELQFGLDIRVPEGKNPLMQYFAIGVKGYLPGSTAEGIPKPIYFIHEGSDCNLYTILPMVLRDEDDDLTDVQRDLYRARIPCEVKGRRKVAYYLRKVDVSGTECEFIKRVTSVQGGIKEVSDVAYTPTSDNLKPKPQLPPEANVNVVTRRTEIRAVVDLATPLSAFDIAEIKNAMNTLYGGGVTAFSEVALVAGIEVTAIGKRPNGSTFNYKEITEACCCMLATTNVELRNTSSTIPMSYQVAASEPLHDYKNE